MSSIDDAISELVEIPEAREAYDRQTSIIKMAKSIRDMRKQANLTQVELAKKIHSKQSVISRLESPLNDRLPNLGTLVEIAAACNAHIDVTLFSDRSQNPNAMGDTKLTENVIHLQ